MSKFSYHSALVTKFLLERDEEMYRQNSPKPTPSIHNWVISHWDNLFITNWYGGNVSFAARGPSVNILLRGEALAGLTRLERELVGQDFRISDFPYHAAKMFTCESWSPNRSLYAKIGFQNLNTTAPFENSPEGEFQKMMHRGYLLHRLILTALPIIEAHVPRVQGPYTND